MTALTAGTPSSLPLAANVKFTENGARLALGDGLWKAKTTLVTRRDIFADPVSGQVALWSVLDEGGAPVLLSARLKIQDRRVTEIETVVARKGSHALFAPEAFAAPNSVFAEVLEPARAVVARADDGDRQRILRRHREARQRAREFRDRCATASRMACR